MSRLFAYLDRALSGQAADEMETHLEECFGCCDKLAFSRRLDAFVKARLADVEVPAGLEGRLRRGLADG